MSTFEKERKKEKVVVWNIRFQEIILNSITYIKIFTHTHVHIHTFTHKHKQTLSFPLTFFQGFVQILDSDETASR